MEKLSIVVPYRDREEHLKEFVPFMENYLKEEEIPFSIFIIEQGDTKPFNRAKLLNVGFKESENFDYFSFHDVDMLPEDSDYSYADCPTHLASMAEQFGYKLPYDGYFGGVTLFDKESFLKVNGFSNEYWGWGAEDDDLLFRCQYKGIETSRKECRYRSLSHERRIIQNEYSRNIDKYSSLLNSRTPESIINSDGLTSLSYEKISEENLSEFTKKIKVLL